MILPSQVRYGNAVIVLNPSDPVVSGALLLRVYERNEIRFLRDHLKNGDLFIDIGANIGFYTALSMRLLGNDGMVIALEPDPVSFKFLEQTIKLNGPCKVEVFKLAASSMNGTATLYTSSSNRGDNRLHEFKSASDKLNIQTVTIDSLMERLLLNTTNKNVFVKLDIQGGEGLAIRGMKNFINNTGNLTLMMEFWPQGLANMDTDSGELLSELEDAGLNIYELGNKSRLIKLNNKDSLIKRLSGRKYTNIIGLKSKQ
jgi:FkbM family methyltransferase